MKKGKLNIFKFSSLINLCGRWDLNEFPHTVTPHRKELSAHQLIECNQKYNQLVNRLFTLLFNKLELVYFFINEFSVPKL